MACPFGSARGSQAAQNVRKVVFWLLVGLASATAVVIASLVLSWVYVDMPTKEPGNTLDGRTEDVQLAPDTSCAGPHGGHVPLDARLQDLQPHVLHCENRPENRPHVPHGGRVDPAVPRLCLHRRLPQEAEVPGPAHHAQLAGSDLRFVLLRPVSGRTYLPIPSTRMDPTGRHALPSHGRIRYAGRGRLCHADWHTGADWPSTTAQASRLEKPRPPSLWVSSSYC